MGLFDMFSKNKKTVKCCMCDAAIQAGTARQIDGKTYCQNCFNRILDHASQSRARGNGGNTGNYGGNGGGYGGNTGSYGNGGGYSGNTGSYGSNGGSYSGNGGGYGGNTGNYTGNTGSQGTNKNMPAVIWDIKVAFDAADLRYKVDHIGDQWELAAGISGKGNTYTLKFICKDGSKDDIAMRVFSIASVNAGNRAKVLETLNGFQRKYRFLRFTIDSDNDVKIEYDMHTCGADIGKAAAEMMIRTMKIVDDIYPELMKQIWS